MSSKCAKSKNPCKICLGPVTRKNGLHCEGVCDTWVHFACLNYTPGKISDIKAGLIKVVCPCPDCATALPKEVRTDLPFSCTNNSCPANKPPQCVNTACPATKAVKTSNAFVTCNLAKCSEEDCRVNKKSDGYPQATATNCQNFQNTNNAGVNTRSYCKSESYIPKNKPNNNCQCSESPPKTSSSCINSNDPNIQMVYNTIGHLSNQINDLTRLVECVMKQQTGAASQPRPQIEQNTSRAPTCNRPGPKNNCPQPCYCPKTPINR